jgi:hypothetical protein
MLVSFPATFALAPKVISPHEFSLSILRLRLKLNVNILIFIFLNISIAKTSVKMAVSAIMTAMMISHSLTIPSPVMIIPLFGNQSSLSGMNTSKYFIIEVTNIDRSTLVGFKMIRAKTVMRGKVRNAMTKSVGSPLEFFPNISIFFGHIDILEILASPARRILIIMSINMIGEETDERRLVGEFAGKCPVDRITRLVCLESVKAILFGSVIDMH